MLDWIVTFTLPLNQILFSVNLLGTFMELLQMAMVLAFQFVFIRCVWLIMLKVKKYGGGGGAFVFVFLVWLLVVKEYLSCFCFSWVYTVYMHHLLSHQKTTANESVASWLHLGKHHWRSGGETKLRISNMYMSTRELVICTCPQEACTCFINLVFNVPTSPTTSQITQEMKFELFTVQRVATDNSTRVNQRHTENR